MLAYVNEPSYGGMAYAFTDSKQAMKNAEANAVSVLNSQLSTFNSQHSLAPAAHTGLRGDIVRAQSGRTVQRWFAVPRERP
jgi:hypothetical protein